MDRYTRIEILMYVILICQIINAFLTWIRFSGFHNV